MYRGESGRGVEGRVEEKYRIREGRKKIEKGGIEIGTCRGRGRGRGRGMGSVCLFQK